MKLLYIEGYLPKETLPPKPIHYKSKGLNWKGNNGFNLSNEDTANVVKMQPKLISVNPNAVLRVQNLRKLVRTHSIIRAQNAREAMPDVFMRIANKDNRRIAQRDARKAAREAKRLNRLING